MRARITLCAFAASAFMTVPECPTFALHQICCCIHSFCMSTSPVSCLCLGLGIKRRAPISPSPEPSSEAEVEVKEEESKPSAGKPLSRQVSSLTFLRVSPSTGEIFMHDERNPVLFNCCFYASHY